nr:hypothetical protein K-LCC10_0018 [Kaumoebavirus]
MDSLPLDALLAVGQYLPKLCFLRRICRSLADCEELASEIGRKINWKKVIDVMDTAARIQQNNPAILRYHHYFPFHYYLEHRAFWNMQILEKYALLWNWSEIPYYEKYNSELLRVYAPSFSEAQWEEFTLEVPVIGVMINEYAEKINWKLFCKVRPINKVLIRTYWEKMDWSLLSKNPKTPYYILEHYDEKFDWHEVGKWADRAMLDKKYHYRLEK